MVSKRTCVYDIITDLLQVGNGSILANDKDSDTSATKQDTKMPFCYLSTFYPLLFVIL